MAGTGGGSEHRQIFRRPKTRMDHQNGRTILYRAGVFAVAAKFLGKIGFVPGPARFEAQEEHARLLLAHRPRERHSFAAKYRTEFALVFHCAPRARSWLLLQSLFASGGSVCVAVRRCA